MTKQEQLQEILYEMFQMGNSDLDFGIYRIMNIKHSEITQFFDKKLFDGDLSFTDEDIVYSNMVEFFSRYYQNGDFVSQRRYASGSTYAIPYNGEEVKLHWANADQYYIKTSEDFKDYTFKTPYATVSFKIKEAETDSNNNKSEKRFFVFTDLIEEENHLVLNFDYKPVSRKGQKLQDKINIESFEVIKEKVDLSKYGLSQIDYYGKDKKKTRTLLEKHLAKYTAKNSFDYFIHKDLAKFLRQELDNFIKSELINLDDILESTNEVKETKFERIKIFKDLSLNVISFLSQLEDFQKKLWEKKKFVIETNYCMTLDKIDEEYYNEIFNNKKQLKEWEILFGDEALASYDGTKVPAPEDIKYLVLDTKFFDTKFKYKLLSKFDNLDEDIDGVLICGENFGALNLLQDRYKEQIKTVYIDPPYNTGNDGFIYSDGYAHSSWMSLMEDRLRLSKNLLSYADSLYFSSIDKNELYNLKMLMDSTLTEFNFINAIVNVNNPKGRSDQKNLPTAHENILFYAKDGAITYGWNPQQKVIRRYNKVDKDGKYRFIDLRKTGDNDRRIDRQNMFYYFYHNEDDGILSVSREELSDKNLIKIPPMKNSATEGRWRWELKTSLENIDRLVAKYMPNKQQWSIFEKDYLSDDERVMPTSVWDEKPFNSERGTETFVNLGFEKEIFKNPKPTGLIEYIFEHSINKTDIILDFFAGSGTTGHAVINLNREDQGKRKYILVEMGEYFDTVTKPRIQKAIYTDSWEDGKPTTKNGVSQIFKYFKLESYEDTLNNLTVKTKEIPSLYKNEYLLHYILDDETKQSQLDIDKFKTPFDYTLQISSGIVGETKEINIDLIETFNYLIGLQVKSLKSQEGMIIVKGVTLLNENIMIIWRENETKINEELQKEFTVYDKVYINGDVDIDAENIYLTEKTFSEQMFKGV